LFPFLAILNNAAINISIQGFCELMFAILLGMNLGVELLGYLMALFNIFEKLKKLVFTLAVSFSIPISNT
jgi:hypothetical protein